MYIAMYYEYVHNCTKTDADYKIFSKLKKPWTRLC